MDEWNVPSTWSDTEADLFEAFIRENPDVADDVMFKMMYHVAYFDSYPLSGRQLERFRADTIDYLYTNYGIDWDEVFDWEEWTVYYEGARA